MLSPADEFAVDKVPLKDAHVKDMKVEAIGLNAVELSVSTHLGLPLVEVALSPCLAVQLLDFVAAGVE